MSGPDLAPPGADDVHVWWIDPNAEDDAGALLSMDERARAERFRRPESGARWAGARAALRRILAAYAGCAPRELTFASGPWGKPEIAGGSSLRFSLAHAGARAVLAVAWEREVGVDLEPIDPAVDAAPLIATTCTPAERARLEAMPIATQKRAFLVSWVLKEAYLKGLGIGLSREPREIEVAVAADGRATIGDASCPDTAAGWSLRLLDAGPGWVAALAAAGAEPRLGVDSWPRTLGGDAY